jgi:hypothetical protein
MRDLNGLLSFVRRCRVSWQARIFEFISPAPQVCEWPESLAELSPDRLFHGIMAPVSRGAQALSREEGIAGEPGGVVTQNISTVGVSVNQTGCGGYGSAGMDEQGAAVG